MPTDPALAESIALDPSEQIRVLRREVASLKLEVARHRRWYRPSFRIGFWLIVGYLLTLSAINAALALTIFKIIDFPTGYYHP